MVIVLRGCSGSGKSTYADFGWGRYAKNRITVSADDYFVKNGTYRFNSKCLGLAHSACMEKFMDFVRSNDDISSIITVDNTNCTVREAMRYITVGSDFHHTIRVITLVMDPDKAHTRNVHGVPLKTVMRQNERLRQSIGKFPEWVSEVVIPAEDLQWDLKCLV